jgi:hypothetical protein
MNLLRPLAAWGLPITLTVCGVFWAVRAYPSVPLDVHAAILISIGIVAALINAGSFQVLRRYDDAPLKELSKHGASRLDRLITARRLRFRFKWVSAVLTGVIAGGCGGLLNSSSLAAFWFPLLVVGYCALVLTLLLGLLVIIEYAAVTNVVRELPKKLKEEREKREMLERLRGETASEMVKEKAVAPASTSDSTTSERKKKPGR